METAPAEFLDTVELVQDVRFPALPLRPLAAIDLTDEGLNRSDRDICLERGFEGITGADVRLSDARR